MLTPPQGCGLAYNLMSLMQTGILFVPELSWDFVFDRFAMKDQTRICFKKIGKHVTGQVCRASILKCWPRPPEAQHKIVATLSLLTLQLNLWFKMIRANPRNVSLFISARLQYEVVRHLVPPGKELPMRTVFILQASSFHSTSPCRFPRTRLRLLSSKQMFSLHFFNSEGI